MKVVVIGGHLTPALATIEELRKNPNIKIYFIGREFAMEGDTNPSVESVTIPKLGIPFRPLTSGRLQRRLTRYTIPSLLKIPYGFWQALRVIKEINPDVVLSFGGYLAVPVVIASRLEKIPVITHEQTVVSGLANKIISRFATQIAVSWEQSLKYFPKNKTVLTGNPVRGEFLNIKRKVKKIPQLYFTGGNQGAHVINEAVFALLPELLEMFEIVHQTGASMNKADLVKANRLKSELPKSLANRYTVKDWLETNDLAKVLSSVTLVISRAGANTVTELATIGLPSILIPIPWVTKDEQTKNAQILAEAGAAVILREAELTPKKLFTTIQLALENINKMEEDAKKFKKIFKNNASSQLADLVVKIGETKVQKDKS